MTEDTAQSSTTEVTHAAQDLAATSSDFVVPESYADRAWAKNIKSQEDLWNQFDNAQKLIGKNPAPAKPEEYKFETTVEGLPDGIDLSSYESKAKNFFHQLGLSPEKANKAWNQYLALEIESAQASKASQAEHQKALDERFNAVTEKLFGDKFEELSAAAQNTIREAVPEDLRQHLIALGDTNPEALAALVAIDKHHRDKYTLLLKKTGGEDSLRSGSQPASADKGDVLKSLVETKAAISRLDPFSPERKVQEAKLNELRGKLQKFF